MTLNEEQSYIVNCTLKKFSTATLVVNYSITWEDEDLPVSTNSSNPDYQGVEFESENTTIIFLYVTAAGELSAIKLKIYLNET